MKDEALLEQKCALQKNISETAIKDEYDFSKGERGKFYNPDAELNIPIYLEPEVLSFVKGIAQKKRLDLSTVVNRLLKSNMTRP
ncbi:hypothetical protein MCHI_001465 [Candidatus Magnetoovum chiemensis]|nr:hypothetical protein MCHI_001465 [Candidatus Magnetoovum chiemensis]